MVDQVVPSMVYDFNHECSYMQYKDEDEADEKYREEMLSVFGMKEFKENDMVNKIEELTAMIQDNERFKDLCSKSANRYVMEDLSIGLMLLFNCDSFHLVHKCLQDFNTTQNVSDENYNLVLKYLEN